jgi:hypothetical protein
MVLALWRSRDSSADWRAWVRFLAGARNFNPQRSDRLRGPPNLQWGWWSYNSTPSYTFMAWCIIIWAQGQIYLIPYFALWGFTSRYVNHTNFIMKRAKNLECLSVCPWLYRLCGPLPLFQFLDLYTVVRNPWTGDQPVERPLHTDRTRQRQSESTQTSMPRVRFEPTIQSFKRAKAVHALDRVATVIGRNLEQGDKFRSNYDASCTLTPLSSYASIFKFYFVLLRLK